MKCRQNDAYAVRMTDGSPLVSYAGVSFPLADSHDQSSPSREMTIALIASGLYGYYAFMAFTAFTKFTGSRKSKRFVLILQILQMSYAQGLVMQKSQYFRAC